MFVFVVSMNIFRGFFMLFCPTKEKNKNNSFIMENCLVSANVFLMLKKPKVHLLDYFFLILFFSCLTSRGFISRYESV